MAPTLVPVWRRDRYGPSSSECAHLGAGFPAAAGLSGLVGFPSTAADPETALSTVTSMLVVRGFLVKMDKSFLS